MKVYIVSKKTESTIQESNREVCCLTFVKSVGHHTTEVTSSL